MAQSLSQLVVHLVFSTKDRVRALSYPDLRSELEAYIVGILRNLECPSLATCCVADHAHVLYLQHRTKATADVVASVKRESSAWIKTQKPEVKDPYLVKFAWQAGYGAFSVSESKVPAVKEYIQRQEEHHRVRTFQEEYREFLDRHNVSYDERYVWD